MKLRSGYENKKARVEMLPLIDVLFLLLVFFIYSMLSMVIHHGIKVELPTAGTSSLEQNESTTITIDANNQLFLNKIAIQKEEIIVQIMALQKEQEKPIYINGDQKANLGIAIELLDDLKKAGIEEISFSCIQENP